MASFVDRTRFANDWDTDGGFVSPQDLENLLSIYVAGGISAADIKSFFSMTTAQATQFDAILATRPSSPLLLLNVPAFVQWKDKISGVIWASSAGYPNYDTDAKVRAALGI